MYPRSGRRVVETPANSASAARGDVDGHRGRAGPRPVDGERREGSGDHIHEECLGDGLGLVVARIDEGDARVAGGVQGLEPAVVGHVGRDVGVRPGAEGVGEERQAGPAAHGDAADRPVRIAGVTECGRAERVRDAVQESG